MKPLATALLLLLLNTPLLSQTNAAPTTSELLRILRIQTFRIRTPVSHDEVWDIKMLKREDLKKRSSKPKGLTVRTGLLSMRDKGNDVYEFTLPERNGAYSQGDFDLCKEIPCSGQYSLKWLKRPLYSADGTQCVLAEFESLGDEKPSHFLTLVRVRNKPM